MKIKASHLEMKQIPVARGFKYEFYLKDLCVGNVWIAPKEWIAPKGYPKVAYQFTINGDVMYKDIKGCMHMGFSLWRKSLTFTQMKQHMVKELNHVIESLEREDVEIGRKQTAIRDVLMNIHLNTPVDKEKVNAWLKSMEEN